MSSRRARVAVVHDGYIPAYRLRLYELLGERTGVEYVVFHGAMPRNLNSAAADGPFSFPTRFVRNREVGVGRKTVVYQHLVREIAGGGYDAVVLGLWLRFASSIVLLAALRARRVPVVFWGQGLEKPEDGSAALQLLLTVNARIKARLARVGAGYLVYTEGGRSRLVAAGLDPDRVFVVRNTLDMAAQTKLREEVAGADPTDLRRRLGLAPDSSVLLFVGSVYPEKRLDELVAAVGKVVERPGRVRPVELVVIGDGPGLKSLREQTSDTPWVHLRGLVTDQREVARHLRVCDAVVCPGGVGLVVNHAFAHGRPVITRESTLHGPEVEYLRDGVNGLIVSGSLDDYADALARLVEDPEERDRLAAGALADGSGLSIEAMADAFDHGVRTSAGLPAENDRGGPQPPGQVNGSPVRTDSASSMVTRVDST